jgi:tellurite resistance protein
MQIDLAFDLASIYEVPFAPDDVGEISTLLALALGVELVNEPSRHDKADKAEDDGETKPWRVVRQMQRTDFAKRVSKAVIQQSVLRNIVPVVGVVVSAVWNQIYLRRFAEQVHNSVRQRLAILRACRGVQLGDPATARIILDGAWLMATADASLGHYEALALSTLIDSLTLPQRIAVHDASFTDDEEGWFKRVAALDPRAYEVLVDVLALVASADGEFNTPERRFLLRLAHTLGLKIDLTAIQNMVLRLREGHAPGHLSGAPVAAPALMPS